MHTIDGYPAARIGSGTYGTVYAVAEPERRVLKLLKAHTVELQETYVNIEELLVKHLLVMDTTRFACPAVAASAARNDSMLMGGHAPTLLLETDSGPIVRAAHTPTGRWAPLVLQRADGFYHVLYRDADLVMQEMHVILPTLRECAPAIVPSELEVITVDGTSVYMAIAMPRLERTHFHLEATPSTELILDRWAERVIPLVARLLSLGIVCTDISRQNIMIDEHGESQLIDVDSCLRLESAERLSPAVGFISLVPRRLWDEPRLYMPVVLKYAMVFAALVCTLHKSREPHGLYPVQSPEAVLASHDRLVRALNPRTRDLVDEHLGPNVRGMAAEFAAVVFASPR